MKIYERVVIDMASMEVEEEDSFEYEGELALCGGGSVGGTEYPTHVLNAHGVLMSLELDMINSTSNPFSIGDVYDPDSRISQMDGYAGMLTQVMQPMQTRSDFDYVVGTTNDMLNAMNSEAALDDMVDAYADRLDQDINSNVLPQFEAGMRDINAVQTSAFVIGRALIWIDRDKAVAAFDADARFKRTYDIGLKSVQAIQDAYRLELDATKTRFEYTKASSHLLVDSGRLGLVAKKEEADGLMEQKEASARWGFEELQYYGNAIASLGAASVQTLSQKSKGASALGGALSGAAAGAMAGSAVPGVGNAVGAVAGAVLGAASGLM